MTMILMMDKMMTKKVMIVIGIYKNENCGCAPIDIFP